MSSILKLILISLALILLMWLPYYAGLYSSTAAWSIMISYLVLALFIYFYYNRGKRDQAD